MSSFHYDFILSKRSSLAKVWLAAHWEKKLSKVQVFETNLQSSVHDILNPRTPIALRTSSHLLVGLVRIYSRKAKYLLTDCSEALVNIKVAFRPGVTTTLVNSKKRKCAKDILDCPFLITEKVDLLDQWVPEVSNIAELDCSCNQSRVEDITLQEEEPMKVTSLQDYFDDEGFGDMFESDYQEQELKNCEMDFKRVYSFADSGCADDGFVCDTTSLSDFSDPFLSPVKDADNGKTSSDRTVEEIKNSIPTFTLESDGEMDAGSVITNLSKHPAYVEPSFEIPKTNYNSDEESEVFELAPIAEVKLPKPSRKAYKRKLLIDEEISIDRQAFFDQLKDTSTLRAKPVFAPRAKRRMVHPTDDVQSLFLAIPMNKPLAPCLENIFQCSPVKKKSNSKSFCEDEIAVENTEKYEDEEDFNAVFIPLHDDDYSSDEEETGVVAMDTMQYYMPEENQEANCTTNDEAELDFDQEEDISHDEFCSFVETTVLKSRPNPVQLDRVVCSGPSRPSRKSVARRFLKCLLMQRDARVRLEQESNLSHIYLHPGAKYVQDTEIV